MRLSAEQIRQAREHAPESGAVQPWHQPQAEPRAPARTRRRLPRRRLRTVLIGVVLLLLVAAAAYLIPTLYATQQAYGKVFSPPPPRPVVTRDAKTGQLVVVPSATAAPAAAPDIGSKDKVNIVLLGVDSNSARRSQGEPPLSDTIIIVSVDPATKSVTMLSIPRDLKVSIPGVGDDKINAAYSNGELSSITGPGLVIATIEQNFGIPIHYYATIDLEGFQKMVDTMGGVTIDAQAPLKDDQYPGMNYDYTRIIFHTGLQHLNGVSALQYARSRHDDNDFARGNRQQQVLMALREQAVSLNLIPKAPDLISQLGDSLRTDIPPADALRLARLASQIKSGDIHSLNLLNATTEQYSPGQPYYLIPDWNKIHQMTAPMMPSSNQSPTTAAPAATAITTPDLLATVQIINGTQVDKLAARSASKLTELGFRNVTTAQAQDAGSYPKSVIYDNSKNPATARLIAQQLGLPVSVIQHGPAPQAGNFQIVVVLGDDAPKPASS